MKRIEALKKRLMACSENGIGIAFSGGVDSTFLLSILAELRYEKTFPIIAVNFHSEFQSHENISDLQHTAEEFKVTLKIFEGDPLKIPEIQNNPPDRCYWCKLYIFTEFIAYLKAHGIQTLVDGTNADDLDVYRPGRKALAELGVISPLAELGFTKADIRKYAEERGLACSHKPASPCLATRFEYNVPLTHARLESVRKGEALLRSYLPETADLRLRVHGLIARIEVAPENMPLLLTHASSIRKGLHGLGFNFITLDLEGFRSGCFDAQIPPTLHLKK